MRRLLASLIAVLFIPGIGLSTQTAVPDSVTPERVLEGASLFNEGSCTFCHATGGRGQGRNGPDLSGGRWLHGDGSFETIFRTLWWGVERDEMKADPPFEFEMHPRGGMPWSRTQTSAVTAYVWSISHPETSEFVAAQAEMISKARSGDGAGAVEVYRRAAARWPEHPLLVERGLNAVAYEILVGGNTEAAMPLFELNAEIYPDSWNVWDSLAEARMVAGERDRAIELYRKSLELNPENANAAEKLAELEAR
jgi:mono/diheme cytochrome c family protein